MAKSGIYQSLALFSVILLASCTHQSEITKRKYTDGHYHDFNLNRDKSVKLSSVDSIAARDEHPVLDKMKEQVLPSLTEIKATAGNPNPTEMLSEDHPLIAERVDTMLQRQFAADSTLGNDTMPECVETALSSQAMVGVGTVGGLITIAAPQAIWFTIIPMIGIPFFLIISLIAAGIAFGKISRGEIDAKWKKWMRIWALCLVVNIVLVALLLMHFTLI